MDLPPLGVDEQLPIMKKTRVSTGIRDLDIILEGGYISPGTVMLLGANGMEKLVLSYHFASAAAKNEHILFVTVDATPATILEKATSYDIIIPLDRVSFIDGYSATIGQTASKEEHIAAIPGPQSLEDISFAVNQEISKHAGKKLRVIFYSLSTLLLYNPRDSMLKFLQVVTGRLRNANSTAFFLVEEGVHDKTLLSMVERIMDEEYIIVNKGGTFEFTARGSALNLPIKLGSNGIVIL